MPAYDDIKHLLSILASKREPSNHHGSRTAVYALKLAMVLEVSPHMAQLIEIGAHLHDIGKLLVPQALLNHVGPLSNEERAEMEKHVVWGWEIVTEAGYDPVILKIVRHHHEKWNGKGYPDGLSGNEIPTEVQVVSICDWYDVLTHGRPYLEAVSHAVAMARIQAEKRTSFNPELVDLFFAKVARE